MVDTGWDGVKAPLPIFDIVNGFFKSIAVRRRFGKEGCRKAIDRSGLAVITGSHQSNYFDGFPIKAE